MLENNLIGFLGIKNFYQKILMNLIQQIDLDNFF